MVKFAGDGSVAHHQDAVGDSKQFLELGRNHDDGMTIVREFIQKFIDFLFSSTSMPRVARRRSVRRNRAQAILQ